MPATERVVGLIPAAGYATRLQPLETSKEMVRVGGRPVIDFLAERMHAAGADELRVVTRPEKEDVVAHGRTLGATVLLAHPATLGESLACAVDGVDAGTTCLIGFPDTLWEPSDAYRPLVDAVAAGAEVALGLWEFPEPERSDVVTFEADGRIAGIHVKPARPPGTWCWEIAAARAGALAGLDDHAWPGDLFDSLVRDGTPLRCVRFHGPYLDIGTRASLPAAEGFLQAGGSSAYAGGSCRPSTPAPWASSSSPTGPPASTPR